MFIVNYSETCIKRSP